MKKVIISVTNDLSTDQRVHKVANSLTANGFHVLLVGRLHQRSKALLSRKYHCHRFKLIFNKGFLFYLEFNVRLFFFLFFKKCDILLSNDLDTLLANFLVSKFKARKLIYDSHELFTEVPELLNRIVVKNFWLYIEKLCLPRVKYTYTVSNSIASYYNKKYDINMSVVRNLPLLKKAHYIKDNHVKKIIYQGAINKDRGVDLMIESMQYVDAKLYILGSGDLLYEMMEYAEKLNLDDKVFFIGKLNFEDLFSITQTADLGLSFEKDTCLAYRYSLPNKIFDYIHAEIPILISDLPEFKQIIEEYDVGLVLNSRDPKEAASQINQLLAVDKKMWLSKISLAKQVLCWENEEKKLLSIFS